MINVSRFFRFQVTHTDVRAKPDRQHDPETVAGVLLAGGQWREYNASFSDDTRSF